MQDQNEHGALSVAQGKTYTEILDLVQDLVVESEVVAGDDIDTGVLLDVPVLETKSLGLFEKLLLGELSAPVCLSCFLQLTESSHAGETKDGSVAGTQVSNLELVSYLRGVELTIEPWLRLCRVVGSDGKIGADSNQHADYVLKKSRSVIGRRGVMILLPREEAKKTEVTNRPSEVNGGGL